MTETIEMPENETQVPAPPTLPPLEERPLVTFAVFAYNQEDYIREAVEGAFSQTYEPLEIILSDDCSTDRTLEIMQEMAATYEGPHQVRVRRNQVNVGTALHVSLVAEDSRGELIIVAAGDDISVPERSEHLVAAWLLKGAPTCALHSSAYSFWNKELNTKALLPIPVNKTDLDLRWFLKENRLPFLSPTCAYTRSIFSMFPPLLGGSVIEDGPLAIRVFSVGKFIPVPSPLVLIRKQSQTAGTGHSINDIARWNAFVHSRITSKSTSLRDLVSVRENDSDVRAAADEMTRQIRQLSSAIISPSACLPIQRLRLFIAILKGRAFGRSVSSRLKRAMKVCFAETRFLSLLYRFKPP